jgi:hypothetical protein
VVRDRKEMCEDRMQEKISTKGAGYNVFDNIHNAVDNKRLVIQPRSSHEVLICARTPITTWWSWNR